MPDAAASWPRRTGTTVVVPTDPQTWLGAQDGLEPPEEDVELEPAITAEELLAEPADFLGEPVAIEAVVEQVLVPGAFTLTAPGVDRSAGDLGGEEGFGDGAMDLEEDVPPEGDSAPDLPVLAAGGAFVAVGPTEEIAAGQTVLVTGLVQDGLASSDLDETYPEAWPDGALDEFVDGPWREVEAVEPVTG
ncbi:hypothetical protein [Quadrisphaera sp. DSM 44207]|uniref:hypothetical protein n=1 Tax=Quadrisphaera sp. DSM 44207 TaxID=1881057 RepID=UPI00088F3073|nr:hypothetical protein [Quadrisphaera sp. DSM 44207]SDQ63405.1 hypothetical protein SAMN05428996_2172 [Quadrisphaera sp. DSM 44207]